MRVTFFALFALVATLVSSVSCGNSSPTDPSSSVTQPPPAAAIDPANGPVQVVPPVDSSTGQQVPLFNPGSGMLYVGEQVRIRSTSYCATGKGVWGPFFTKNGTFSADGTFVKQNGTFLADVSFRNCNGVIRTDDTIGFSLEEDSDLYLLSDKGKDEITGWIVYAPDWSSLSKGDVTLIPGEGTVWNRVTWHFGRK